MRVDHQVLAPVIAQLHDVAPEGVIQGTGSEGVWVHPPHHTGSFVDPGCVTPGGGWERGEGKKNE